VRNLFFHVYSLKREQLMKRVFTLLFCVFNIHLGFSQELFSFTEPASNMPSKSIGFRLTNTLMKEDASNQYNLHLLPEIMVGVNRHFMFHAEGFLSNRNNKVEAEGAAIYGKYRFLSKDDIHTHFRLAAFSQCAFNISDVHQEAIDLRGHNSGFNLGLLATKLINKTAISTSVAFVQAMDNGKAAEYQFNNNNQAIDYTLSIGKLLLPKEYVDYKQTNMNGMLELLCQTNLSTGKTFVDLAPSLQFIILSKMRVDLGYRFPLSKDLYRTATAGGSIRFEYNIFSAFK
jgi:hypothetical protein